ncbi:hypothetical protein HK104_005916 [Borealophlyctis nickersoniae]|nr:hypothetical protein HK104_005916 [Borealophlyctis nickersoniae]
MNVADILSDGAHDVTLWTPNTEPSISFYERFPEDSHTHIHWRTNLGSALNVLNNLLRSGVHVSPQMIAQEGKGWLQKHKNKPISSLPHGYVLYKHCFVTKDNLKVAEDKHEPWVIKGKRTEMIQGVPFRTDPYLFGHPSGDKFRSVPEFVPHFLWLATISRSSVDYADRDYAQCPCLYCPKYVSRLEKFYLHATRPKIWRSGNSIPTPVADAPSVIFRKREIVWLPVKWEWSDNRWHMKSADLEYRTLQMLVTNDGYEPGLPGELELTSRIIYWPGEIMYRSVHKITTEGEHEISNPGANALQRYGVSRARVLEYEVQYQVHVLGTDYEWMIKPDVLQPYLAYPSSIDALKIVGSPVKTAHEAAIREAASIAQGFGPFGCYPADVPSFESYDEDDQAEADAPGGLINHYVGVCFGAEVIRVGDVVRLRPKNGEKSTLCLVIRAIFEYDVQTTSLRLVGDLWRRQDEFCCELPAYDTKMNGWLPLRRSRQKQIVDFKDVAGRFYPVSTPSVYLDESRDSALPPRSYWYEWEVFDQIGPDAPVMPVRFNQRITRIDDPEYHLRERDDYDAVGAAKGINIRHDGAHEQQLVPRKTKSQSHAFPGSGKKRLGLTFGDFREDERRRTTVSKKKRRIVIDSDSSDSEDYSGSLAVVKRGEPGGGTARTGKTSVIKCTEPGCDLVFPTVREMSRHRNEKYGCDVCGAEYHLSVDLFEHHKSQHERDGGMERLPASRVVELEDLPATDNGDGHRTSPSSQGELSSVSFAALVATLKNLQNKPNIEAFKRPVDPVRDGARDYYEKIKNPMDLKTIERKLGRSPRESKYTSVEEFKDDVYLMFNNCRAYNPEGHWLRTQADVLEAQFNQILVKNGLVGGERERHRNSDAGASGWLGAGGADDLDEMEVEEEVVGEGHTAPRERVFPTFEFPVAAESHRSDGNEAGMEADIAPFFPSVRHIIARGQELMKKEGKRPKLEWPTLSDESDESVIVKRETEAEESADGSHPMDLDGDGVTNEPRHPRDILWKDTPSSVVTAPIQTSAASGPISPSASATIGTTSDFPQTISFQWTTEDGSINVWHCTASFVTGAQGKLEGFHPTTPTLLKVLSACPLEIRYATSTMLRYKGLALALNLWQSGRYVRPDDSEEDARRKPFCMIVNLNEDATKLPEIERALEVLGIGSNTSNKRHSKYLAVFRKDDIRGFVALDDEMRLFVVGAVEDGVFDEIDGKDIGLAVEQFTQAVDVGSLWRAANQTVPPPTMIASAAGELLPPAADEHPRPQEKTIEGSEHIPQHISLEAASIVAQYPKADKRDLEAPAATTTIPVAVYRTSKGVTRMDLTIPAAMDTLAELRSAALCAVSLPPATDVSISLLKFDERGTKQDTVKLAGLPPETNLKDLFAVPNGWEVEIAMKVHDVI